MRQEKIWHTGLSSSASWWSLLQYAWTSRAKQNLASCNPEIDELKVKVKPITMTRSWLKNVRIDEPAKPDITGPSNEQWSSWNRLFNSDVCESENQRPQSGWSVYFLQTTSRIPTSFMVFENVVLILLAIWDLLGFGVLSRWTPLDTGDTRNKSRTRLQHWAGQDISTFDTCDGCCPGDKIESYQQDRKVTPQAPWLNECRQEGGFERMI